MLFRLLLFPHNTHDQLGRHDQEDFEQADLVVANPAIPIQSPHLQAALSADVAVTTEIGLFAAAYRGKTIAVTGTSGKTTTTTRGTTTTTTSGGLQIRVLTTQ